MALLTVANRAELVGDGVTTTFPFSFLALDEDHIHVYIGEDSVELTQGVDFTVTGAGEATGGNVTLTSALGSGVDLVILREVPALQEKEFALLGRLPPDQVEQMGDIATMLAQQVLEKISRCLILPKTLDGSVDPTLPQPVANRMLGWNASGTEIINLAELVGVTTVTPFAEALLDDADAAAARATLDLTDAHSYAHDHGVNSQALIDFLSGIGSASSDMAFMADGAGGGSWAVASAVKIATGTYTGDGVAGGQAVTGVGFSPDIFWVFGHSGTGLATAIKTDQDGTYAFDLHPDSFVYALNYIVSLDSDGATVKGTHCNASGVAYTFIAMKY